MWFLVNQHFLMESTILYIPILNCSRPLRRFRNPDCNHFTIQRKKWKQVFWTQKAVQKIIFPLVQSLKSGIPETLPAYLLQRYALMNLTESLINIHFPKNPDLLNKSRQRLKFEELFYIQLSILRFTKWRAKHSGFYFRKSAIILIDFTNIICLFELTTPKNVCCAK